jgi:topoisomerase-4 subunit A
MSPTKPSPDNQSELILNGPESAETPAPDIAPDETPPPPSGPVSHHTLPDDSFRSLFDSNFMQYASYVIRDRAIPQLEDGLKPVQRRILHSLWENDDGKFNKVANIVGHCMRYHPHGDVSIADALVGITQKRYLIEGQGNFGNIYTGDPAAASRYIECRLTELARNEIFNPKLTATIPSYDGRNKEPVVLPSKLPLTLMLGTEGIAVGLSTRILPHNFIELLKAQIAILQEKRFRVLPDFPQGGLMDASEYNKGNGKVKVRAVIEKRDANKLVIKEIPFGTTTDSLIGSIEDAARKKKIKIRSIQDFTAATVEILVTLTQGEDPDKSIAALYHFTQCEVSISSNIVVIHGNQPVEMTVDEILEANTSQLKIILQKELELKQRELQNDLHNKTLTEIFIEERIYKRIEDKESYEAVQQAVLKGLDPFKSRLRRAITLDDVEMLLDLRIKRISKFDLKKNRDDIDKILLELKQIEKHLKNLIPFAISYLEGLVEKYAKEYKRRTRLSEVEEIDVRKITANALAIVHDTEKGFIGHGLKGDPVFRCSPVDKLLIVWDDGRFQMVPPPEKMFVDQNVIHLALFDRDKVHTVVFTTKDATYAKKFTFGGVIQNKDYSCTQEGEKTKIHLFKDKELKGVHLRYRKVPGIRVLEEDFDLKEIPVRGAKTMGNQLTKKSVNSASPS